MRLVLMSLLLAGFTPAFANESPQALQDAFTAAVLANDADAVAACYTPGATNFPISIMTETGRDSVRVSWQGFFATYTAISLSLSDKHMETIADTSMSWGLFSMTVEPLGGGDPVVMRGRYSDVSKNVDGQWLYVFDHASMPFVSGDGE